MGKPAIRNQPFSVKHLYWYPLALAGIFVFSLLLRFWRLGFLNTLVFDEVYYPVFANRYLLGEPVYNAHPPLSQYILTLGIWLGSHLPIGQEITNGLLGSVRSTFSYRWLNALTGSFIPLVVGAIAYQLTHRRTYSAIATLFAALDGLFLVESRFALNNVYLVIFGLLGQWFFLLALTEPLPRRWYKLVLSGFFFGLSASIKWNGLGFLLGIYLIWAIAWVFAATTRWRHQGNLDLEESLAGFPNPRGKPNRPLILERKRGEFPTQTQLPLANLTQLNLLHLAGYLGAIPVATYCLSWVPHLLMNPKPGFLAMQQRILTFHQAVGSGPDVHPYCSPWYSWLVMWRPVAYLYQTARNTQETIPSLPPLPKGSAKIVYDVHAMGNPILWWLSTAAIFLVLGLSIWRFCWKQGWRGNLTTSSVLALYLICNYCANLLPWLKVTRCTFIYHYMASSVFSGFAIAWIVDAWLHSPRYIFRQMALAMIFVIVLGFFFWLPIFMGLPLSPEGYQLRMWFSNWI